MALTPEQASQLTPSDYDVVQSLEKDIDTKLLAQFNTAAPKYEYVFSTKGESKPKPKVIFELQRRYEVAGWRVVLTRSESEDIFSMVLEATAMVAEPMTAHRALMQKEAD